MHLDPSLVRRGDRLGLSLEVLRVDDDPRDSFWAIGEEVAHHMVVAMSESELNSARRQPS